MRRPYNLTSMLSVGYTGRKENQAPHIVFKTHFRIQGNIFICRSFGDNKPLDKVHSFFKNPKLSFRFKYCN